MSSSHGRRPKIIRREANRGRVLGHQGWCQSVAFSPNHGSNIVSCDRAGILLAHSADPPPHGLARLAAFNDSLDLQQLSCCVWYSEDVVAYGSTTGAVRLRNVHDGATSTSPDLLPA